MKTFIALISFAHTSMGGHGIAVRAENRQEAYKAILNAAEQQEIEGLSQEHIMQFSEIEDGQVIFFEEGNIYGSYMSKEDWDKQQ